MRKPAIKQADNRPPTGGWSIIYIEKGQKFDCSARSAYKVVELITEIQKINHTFTTIDAVWDYCNDIWRARDPKRAIPEEMENRMPELPKVMQRDHWKIEPSRYGSMVWRWLHMFGTFFEQDAWDMALKRTQSLLDPNISPNTGCPECSKEFAQILATDPPTSVHNEREAAEWTWRVHNRVNRRIGAPQVSFKDAAKFYGWKVEL
jgi:hypothetical protein